MSLENVSAWDRENMTLHKIHRYLSYHEQVIRLTVQYTSESYVNSLHV